MVRTVEQMNLGADQLGEFYALVDRQMRKYQIVADETYITEEQKADAEDEVKVMVFGSRGTNLVVTFNDNGWSIKEMEE
jgi:hypothetical protein